MNVLYLRLILPSDNRCMVRRFQSPLVYLIRTVRETVIKTSIIVCRVPYIRLRSHRSRLFGYTVYVFESTRILEIKHYDFLIPGHIGEHYSKSSYRRV